MKSNLILETAHILLKSILTKDDIVVDATMGNGYDTLFLAKHASYVYAFDIQQKAIFHTTDLLNLEGINNVKLILDSHEHINSYIKNYRGVLFNLGYLPHGDKNVCTKSISTLSALKSICPQLKINGFVMLVIYLGHLEGKKESVALDAYVKTLDKDIYKVMRIDLPYQDNYPPYILYILKTKDES